MTYRVDLAAEIAQEYPGFTETYELIRRNDQVAVEGKAFDASDMLYSEISMLIDLFQEAEEERTGQRMEIGVARLVACVADMRYLILLAAYEVYFEESKETARGLLSTRCAEALQNSSYEGSFAQHVALLFALWFSDYPGFRQRVFELYPGIKATEGVTKTEASAEHSALIYDPSWVTVCAEIISQQFYPSYEAGKGRRGFDVDSAEMRETFGLTENSSLVEEDLTGWFYGMMKLCRAAVSWFGRSHPELAQACELVDSDISMRKHSLHDLLEELALLNSLTSEGSAGAELSNDPMFNGLIAGYLILFGQGKDATIAVLSRSCIMQSIDSLGLACAPSSHVLVTFVCGAAWLSNFGGFRDDVAKLCPGQCKSGHAKSMTFSAPASMQSGKKKPSVIGAGVAVILAALVVGALAFNAFGGHSSSGGTGQSGAANSSVQTSSSNQGSSSSANSNSASVNAASTGDDNYVLPESSVRVYSASELSGLSSWDLCIARNEIFARYGRGFNDETLQSYFNSKSWYTRQYSPEQFDAMASPLTDTELANIDVIKSLE